MSTPESNVPESNVPESNVPESNVPESNVMVNRRRRRPSGEPTLLRPLPGDTPIHRLWAGTKLLGVAAVAVVLSVRPEWTAVGVLGGLVLAGLIIARIPLSAAPRLPRWFIVVFFLGALLTLRSVRPPLVHVAGIALSMGALDEWARYTVLFLVIVTAAALTSWTTPLAEVAPALSRLGTPLRWCRLPVDEWAVGAALSIRCLPLLIDEIRTLTAARRLRQRPRDDNESRLRWAVAEARDLLLASLTVSLRRAHEFGDAIEARGGIGMVSDSNARPRMRDGLALAVIAVVAVVAMIV